MWRRRDENGQDRLQRYPINNTNTPCPHKMRTKHLLQATEVEIQPLVVLKMAVDERSRRAVRRNEDEVLSVCHAG